MKYPELSPYRYNSSLARPGLLNFGWLEDEIPIGGERDARVVELLSQCLPFRARRSNWRVAQARRRAAQARCPLNR
jgi:hypothetical protein